MTALRWIRALAVPTAILLAASCSPDGASDSNGADRAAAPADDGPCGRDCLIGLLDTYLLAVVAHDAAAVPLAPGYRETQNAVETPAGEGVWTTATGFSEPGRRYADPEAGQAGYVGLMGEGANTAIAGLRIAVEGRAIAEAEWVVVRDGMSLFNPAGLNANPPPDSGDGPGREAALTAVESYFDGVEAADPAIVRAHPACYRSENGTWAVGEMPGRVTADPADAQPGFTAPISPYENSSCLTGFENLRSVTEAVLGRRYFYDPDAGVVWVNGVFQRAPEAVTRDGSPLPWLYFVSIFRVDDSGVRGLHAVMDYLPEEVRDSGWPD